MSEKPTSVIRSFRMEDEAWETFKVRAEKDGESRSSAIAKLVSGYVEGLYPLPVGTVSYTLPKGKTKN